MSQVFDDGTWLPAAQWRVYGKMTEIVNPTKTWVLLDEHPDSINNAFFTVYVNKPVWEDLPASYHNGACGFAFADGHSEIKTWLEPFTRQPVRFWSADVFFPFIGEPLPLSQQLDHLWIPVHAADRNAEYPCFPALNVTL